MNPTASHLVPKVHPLDRAVEADDPLELMAEPVPGDPAVMLECLLQEFAGLGEDADDLLAMFRSPAYPLLNMLLAHYGEAELRRRVTDLLGRSGVFRVRETMAEDPDSEDDGDDGPELIQLGVRAGRGPAGGGDD
jgi:hypothetical protein